MRRQHSVCVEREGRGAGARGARFCRALPAHTQHAQRKLTLCGAAHSAASSTTRWDVAFGGVWIVMLQTTLPQPRRACVGGRCSTDAPSRSSGAGSGRRSRATTSAPLNCSRRPASGRLMPHTKIMRCGGGRRPPGRAAVGTRQRLRLERMDVQVGGARRPPRRA